MKLHDIAVVGASGLVGRKILQVLDERGFPSGKILAIASDVSHGREITINKRNYILRKLEPHIFKNLEFVFFSAGAPVSHEYAALAVSDGAIVIDNSSAFRMNDDVPLVVPEINRQDIFKNKGIIANPNCSTIQLVMVLKPLDNLYRIRRVVVSTYQSVTGKGNRGVMQLESELQHGTSGFEPAFPHPIAYNAIPQVDIFLEDGYTREEYKMIHETKKLMHNYDIQITTTCARIPTLGGHCESVNIEFDKKIDIEEAKEAISGMKGVSLMDDPANNSYPMPITAMERDEVFVGRIRKDFTVKNGINLWIVSDSLRKGGATNAVQIAEELIKGK
jgi:aspartate-semialdehyde dehydrogenase